MRIIFLSHGVGRTPWSARVPLDPPFDPRIKFQQADEGVGRGPGGPPHRTSSYLLFLSNNLLHNLRRPRANSVQPNIAPRPPDRIFGGVAETAENLHAIIGDFLGQL